jgi:hypothetical protein
MTRNHLLLRTLRPSPGASVWRMTMTVLGAAFGAPRRRSR